MSNYVIIRGDWLRDGYIQDLTPRRMEVAMVEGRAYKYNELAGVPDTRDPPLVLTIDGEISHPGAAPGWGFMPDAGEIERARTLGVVFDRAP